MLPLGWTTGSLASGKATERVTLERRWQVAVRALLEQLIHDGCAGRDLRHEAARGVVLAVVAVVIVLARRWLDVVFSFFDRWLGRSARSLMQACGRPVSRGSMNTPRWRTVTAASYAAEPTAMWRSSCALRRTRMLRVRRIGMPPPPHRMACCGKA